MNAVATATAAVVAASLLLAAPAEAGLHASCHVTWTFGNTTCAVVNQKLTAAFSTLAGSDCPAGTEKCGYSLESSTATSIKGKHETPKKHYKDDLSFAFSQQADGCTVKGYSTSETWYAVLDDGTNYCNMHNLAESAGLVDLYQEETSNKVCTQYSSANCNKY